MYKRQEEKGIDEVMASGNDQEILTYFREDIPDHFILRKLCSPNEIQTNINCFTQLVRTPYQSEKEYFHLQVYLMVQICEQTFALILQRTNLKRLRKELFLKIEDMFKELYIRMTNGEVDLEMEKWATTRFTRIYTTLTMME